ncbi:hypothetical protein LHU53_13890 [Rhodoferax sp. U2-2l]|uniref:hypothetical protein n=1 Tax=Rhodoferax sp. U2-2l TaxID=2884000 RepID=UPI001D0A3F33|nr:hypothetical protein [Rhodoferax sp. U2-2l]MCB8747998.1 hypothetical protein [Rhodoferax sp. U2-2l]
MKQLETTHPSGTGTLPPDAPRTRWMPVASGHSHPTASAAYFKAQAQSFGPSAEMHDWMVVMDELSQQPRP